MTEKDIMEEPTSILDSIASQINECNVQYAALFEHFFSEAALTFNDVESIMAEINDINRSIAIEFEETEASMREGQACFDALKNETQNTFVNVVNENES